MVYTLLLSTKDEVFLESRRPTQCNVRSHVVGDVEGRSEESSEWSPVVPVPEERLRGLPTLFFTPTITLELESTTFLSVVLSLPRTYEIWNNLKQVCFLDLTS